MKTPIKNRPDKIDNERKEKKIENTRIALWDGTDWTGFLPQNQWNYAENAGYQIGLNRQGWQAWH